MVAAPSEAGSVAEALAVHELGHALGQRRLDLVEALGRLGHEGIHDVLDVDALGLGHLGDGLAVLELGAELLLADAERLGGRGQGLAPAAEAAAGTVPAGVALGAAVGRVGGVGGVGGVGLVLGAGEVRGAEQGAGRAAAGEGEREGGGADELAVEDHGGSFHRVTASTVATEPLSHL